LDQTVEDCLENLEERARQQYLHCGKILRQSETAKTQLFFWQCFRSRPFALDIKLFLKALQVEEEKNMAGDHPSTTMSG
jgi:hypothetical protein